MLEFFKVLTVFFTVSEGLWCGKCGEELNDEKAKPVYLESPMALDKWNSTINHQKYLVQKFKNPNGNIFDVIQFESNNIKSKMAYPERDAIFEHSWFPGYGWRIAVCPFCGAFHGWIFEPVTLTSFFADADKHFIAMIDTSITFFKKQAEKIKNGTLIFSKLG